MSAHTHLPRHARHRTRPSWLRPSGLVALVAAALLACTTTAPAAPVESGVSSLVTTKAPRTLVDPARAPYGSGTLSSSWQNTNPIVSTTLTWQRVRDNNGVMVFGDSIANQTSFEFATRMWDQHDLFTAVHNHPGRPTWACVDALEDYAEYIPDRGLVMACGSNDVFDPDDWWEQIDRVLEIADGRPVYWISAYVERRGTGVDPDRKAADIRNSAWVNQQLYAMAMVHENLKVVDWYAAVASGGNEQRVSAWLTDGVHLTNPSGIYGWCNTLEGRMGL